MLKIIISVDLETKSCIDLKTQGARVYWESDTTDIICLCYQTLYYDDSQLVQEDPVKTWVPGDAVPEDFLFENKELYLRAWNASEFERLAWRHVMEPRYGFPVVELEHWLCSAFMSRANNLPGSLDNAARCLKLPVKKDYRGSALIKQLSIPQQDGTFNTDPQLIQEMIEYCERDVKVEVAIVKQLREPSPDEWIDFHANCRINDLGLRIDTDLCVAAQSYAAEEEQDLLDEIKRLTDGEVEKVRGEKLKKWVLTRLTVNELDLIKIHKDGEKKYPLDKQARAKLIACETVDPIVVEVLEASDAAQKSSVGKFRAMERRASSDNRVRGAFMSNGASQTGRWSSSGAQVHNFPRDVAKDPAAVRQDLVDDIHPEDIVEEHGASIMKILSSMLRAAIIPADGYVFLDADYSSIEGRVAPWLCNNEFGEEKLNIYRDHIDPYCVAAAAIYHASYEEIKAENGNRRQVGKVAELSLQFGGGVKAFLGMAAGFGVSMSGDEAMKVVQSWRRANPWATQAWRALEHGFRSAITQPNIMHDVGRVQYCGVPDVLCGGITVFCVLPDGRPLTYPDCRIEWQEGQHGEREVVTYLRSSWTPKASEKDWPRSTIWGGTLLENITQATAASLMRWSVRELDDQYAPIIATIHDQALLEVPTSQSDYWSGVLSKAMNTAPAWAVGLPVEAEVNVCERFGK